MAHSIDVESLQGMISAGDAVTLVDARRKADYEAAPQRIPGAVWLDPETVDTWAAELPVGHRTVVYCVKGGPVSQSVVERLRRNGREALFLEGGLKAWTDAGRSVQGAEGLE